MGSSNAKDFTPQINYGLASSNMPKSDLARALEGASIPYPADLFQGLFNGGRTPYAQNQGYANIYPRFSPPGYGYSGGIATTPSNPSVTGPNSPNGTPNNPNPIAGAPTTGGPVSGAGTANGMGMAPHTYYGMSGMIM